MPTGEMVMDEEKRMLYVYNKLCDRYGFSSTERWSDLNKVVPQLVDRMKFDGVSVSYDTDSEGNIAFINFPSNFKIDW